MNAESLRCIEVLEQVGLLPPDEEGIPIVDLCCIVSSSTDCSVSDFWWERFMFHSDAMSALRTH